MFNQVLGKFSPAWKRACTDLYPQMEDAELQISANSNRRGLTKDKLKEIKGKAVRKLDTVACQFIRRQRVLSDFFPVLFFFFFFKKKLGECFHYFSLALCASSVIQSCPTLCDPMDYSLPGPSVLGISQARILECMAIPFSRGSS